LPYFEQETTELPRFYVELVRQDLGRLWDWLPEGALFHDPYAYLKCQGSQPDPAGEIVPPFGAKGAATEDGRLQALTRAPGWSEPSTSRGEPGPPGRPAGAASRADMATKGKRL